MSVAQSAFFIPQSLSASFAPFQYKGPESRSDEQFMKLFQKFCPLISFEDGYVPVGVDSFLAEAELKTKETKILGLMEEERTDHIILPSGSCSFEKMGHIKIGNTDIMRQQFEPKLAPVSTVFFESTAKGSLKAPIYVSVLNPKEEEKGIPSPTPFIDLLYCFLLSPPEAYWECIVVRIDNNYNNILGICLNYFNLSHPLRGWFFPPPPHPSSSSSSSSGPSFFEVKKGTTRPILCFGRGNRKGANAFFSPQKGENDLWDPSLEVITSQDLAVQYKGRWSETNKDFQQLQKIFYSRVQGGPSPLRVIKCPVKWEEKKDDEGTFFVASSPFEADVMFGKRSSDFFSINNGVNDLVWSVYDPQKMKRPEIKFSVMAMDGGCFMKDTHSGVKTIGFLSPKADSFFYISRFQTREKPIAGDIFYVCITETDFNETGISNSMVIPRQVEPSGLFGRFRAATKVEPQKRFRIVWEADPSYALDLRDGTNARNLVVLKKKKEGRLSQLWEFRECSADWRPRRDHLVNVGSGMVLDMRGGAKSGAMLQQYPAKISSVENQMVKYDAQKRKLFIGGYVVTVFEGKPEEGIELLEGEEMGIRLTTIKDSSSLKATSQFAVQRDHDYDPLTWKTKEEPPFLEVVVTKNAEKIFDDENMGAVPVSFSLFNPISPAGFYCLGTYGEQGHSPVMSEFTTLIRRRKDTDFVPFTCPLEYKLVWSTQGWFSKRSVWVWKMIPPPGFVAFGVACTTSKSPPPINANEFKVVHESLCHFVTANFTKNHLENNLNIGFPFWADQRTGSKLSITFWKTSPRSAPSVPPSSPSSNPREFTSSALSLVFPIQSRSFPAFDLFPELLFSSFLSLKKSRHDGYMEVEEYNQRNFTGIHCAIRTVYDVKSEEKSNQELEYSWGEETKEEEKEEAEDDREDPEEGLEGRKVLPMIHDDEGEILRMVKNWIIQTQLSVGKPLPAQTRRDVTLDCITYVPFYQFEVCGSVKKDWKEIRDKDENSAHFLNEHIEVVEFACADESQMNLFAEMNALSFFPPALPPSPPVDFSQPVLTLSPPSERDEKEREEVKKAEEKRYDFYAEKSDGEVMEGFGFVCGWKEAWKKVESSAIEQILQKSESFANTKTYLSDVRCLVKISSLRVTLYYYPLLNCSFAWGANTNRTSVWVDGLSETVFSTKPTAMQKTDREENEKSTPRFMSGSKLMSLDGHMNYNPYRMYLTLPNPSSMGHFGLWNRGPSPVVIQAVFRANGRSVGTPALIPPGQQFSTRYMNQKDIVICVVSGDNSHLHIIGVDPSSYSKKEHLNLLNASSY